MNVNTDVSIAAPLDVSTLYVAAVHVPELIVKALIGIVVIAALS